MSDESGGTRENQTESASEPSDVKPESGESTSSEKVHQSSLEESNLSAENTSNSSATPELTSSSSGAPSSGVLRRLIWLDQRVNEARQKTFSPEHAGWPEYDVARHARDGVIQIGETGLSSWAVLLLERDAAALLIRAHAARENIRVSGGQLSDADWELVRKVPVIQEAWNNLSAVQVSSLTAAMGPDGDHSLATLPVAQRKTFAIGLHEFVTALAEPLEFEANRLGRALFARYTRVAVAAVVVLGVVGIVGNWIGAKFEKPNIALHRHVDISSQYPGEGLDHSLLVDGDRTNLGFHTECQGGWAIIDLGATKRFDKLVVYNRVEFPERAIPLVVEVSDDRQNFRQIAEKKEVFDKWSATGLAAQGRYVRLKNASSNCFHLAEVEIY